MTVLTTFTDPYATVRVAVYEAFVTSWMSVPRADEILTSILERAVRARDEAVPGGTAAPSTMRFDWRATGEAVPGRGLMADVAASAQAATLPPEETKRRAAVIGALRMADRLTVDELVDALDQAGLPHLLRAPELRSMLSPIGIAHLYRQLYFDAGAGTGPIEQAFTLAPLEQMEVVQEVTRRETAERIETFGTETTLEKSAEETATDEISDRVQTAMRRDLQVGLSTSASGSIGVWSGSVQASTDLGQSSERARETATTRSVTQTRKAGEMLRKSYSLAVKTFTDLNERSSVKRVIRNDTDVPVNYGLRRVLRSVRVKLQSLGPRLVWQLYVERPGAGLSLSKMVMFRDSDSLAPGTAPNAPPRPSGGTETGTQHVRVLRDGVVRRFELSVPADPLRTPTALTITSVTAVAAGDGHGSGLVNSTAAGTPVVGADGKTVAVTYRFELAPPTSAWELVAEGRQLDVEYVVAFEPSAEALAAWQEQVRAAQAAWDAQRADEAIERARRTITAKSRIRPRPPADLRDEERYELVHRFIASAFGQRLPAVAPAPAEVELFHRYFDVAALFYWVHPSWWLPRARRDEYEVTEDSEPAPFGRSLGWLIQLDGDRRRNELLNSPWVRACLPIQPGMERAALEWLARHVEGTRGFDVTAGSTLGDLLAEVEARRTAEGQAAPGPDYVTYDGQIPLGREAAAATYPVVDEFHVTVPTEGFIYDLLTVST